MRMGLPLHVMSTSSSLNTLTPSFVNIKTVLLSVVLPTLIKDVGKSWNVSACIAQAEFVEWDLGDMFSFACASIGNPNPLS